MGNQFGCTAGERPEKEEAKPVDKGSTAEQPLLAEEDPFAILLTPEDVDAGPPPKPEGSSVQNFKSIMELCFRLASACIILSLPLLVPEWNTSLMKIKGASAWMAQIPGGVVLMVLFTVYQNLGNTIQLAYQGATGTLIACAWSHCICANMPYGAYCETLAKTDPSAVEGLTCAYDATTVNAANITLIVLSLWLNISKNVRMFILSYHVYFVMAIQTPSADPLMNTSWSIDWEAQTTTTLCTALIGLAGAVVVILVPTPRMAKTAARNGAITSAKQCCDMVQELTDYYNRSEPSVVIAKLETDAVALRNTVDGLQANIEAAWWEHFDFGKGGRIRALLTKHVSMLKTLTDNVFAMQICISKEDFAKSHVTCMTKIEPQVSGLLDAARQLLADATEAAADGSISKEEADSIRKGIDTTNDSIKDLACAFNDTRKQMFPDKVITVDLQAESFFVYCLSIHARRAVDYATMMLDSPPKPSFILVEMVLAFKDVFKPSVLLARIKPHGFTIRASLEMLISYFMGLYVFDFNAAAACTISLLLADFVGSAMIKNMGRLTAIVLSAIVPHIIVKVQGSTCDPFFVCLKTVSIFFWELFCNYVYISSPTYGFIGILCGAFSLGTLIYPCTHHESAAAAAAAEDAYSVAQYTKILQTTYAVIIMLIVDTILSPGRASSLAIDEILKGMMSIDAWFQAAFMARTPAGETHEGLEERTDVHNDKRFAAELAATFSGKRAPGTIMVHLSGAEQFGAEADKEARYHRAAWPVAFFDKLVRQGHILRANLNMVEQVLEGSKSDSLYTDDFAKIRASDNWKAVRDDVINTFGDAIMMVQCILNNETNLPLPAVVDKASAMENADKLDALQDLFVTINRSGLKYPKNAELDTLEVDVICRLNVVLMLMDASNDVVASIIKECLTFANSK